MCVWFLVLLFCLRGAWAVDAEHVFVNDRLLRAIEGVLETRAVSDECQSALDLYIENIQSSGNDSWAFQMFDATSKLPVGITRLNFGELGQFSQCLEAESEDGSIQPKYCLGTLNLDGLLGATESLINQQKRAHRIREAAGELTNFNADAGGVTQMGISWAVCLPSQCSAEEIEEVLSSIVTPGSLRCQTKDSLNLPLTNGAIATIVVLSVVAFLLVQSTAVDLYFRYVDRAPPNVLLIAFSMYSNGEKLFKVSSNSNELTCLNGIRFWSMMWVVIGHVYSNFILFPIFNALDVLTWFDSLKSMTIVSGTLSVDSFFFMSGLLLVYGYMKAKNQGTKFNIFVFYIHRYLRLTPALAAAVLVTANLLKYMGTGPRWASINSVEQQCQKYWWTTLLYVQNYVNDARTGMCLSQTWYLSVDMQLYILTPLVLLPLKYPKIGVGIIIATIVAFIITPFCIAYITGIPALISNISSQVPVTDYMRYYYYKTHARAAPWFIGVLFGYILARLKFEGRLKHLKLNKILVLLMWAACLAVILTCIYAGHGTLRGPTFSIWASSFYLALVRPTWAVCLSWVVFACMIGYGGPINWLLSFPVYQVLNRFTYSIYLIHFPLLIILGYAARTAVYFDDMNLAYSFWGITMFSFIISVIWVLAFESPITVLEKVIFRSPKKASRPLESENKTELPA